MLHDSLAYKKSNYYYCVPQPSSQKRCREEQRVKLHFSLSFSGKQSSKRFCVLVAEGMITMAKAQTHDFITIITLSKNMTMTTTSTYYSHKPRAAATAECQQTAILFLLIRKESFITAHKYYPGCHSEECRLMKMSCLLSEIIAPAPNSKRQCYNGTSSHFPLTFTQAHYIFSYKTHIIIAKAATPHLLWQLPINSAG